MSSSAPTPDGSSLVRTIDAHWRRNEAPDLSALMASVDRGDEEAWCAALLADAEQRSERKLTPTLEQYLAIFPWLEPGSRTVQELLAVEVADLPRDAAGLESDLLTRYGQGFADDIRIVVELRALLHAVTTDPRPSPRPDPQPGEVLGKYHLRRAMGRGAFGQVWLAWDDELRCFVALKLIPPPGDVDPRASSLLAEARVASSLNHPNVVSVRAAGRFPPPRDWLYIDMQLCGDPAPTREDPRAVAPGQPLTEVRGRFAGDWRSIARIMVDIVSGVVAAHAQGVVHCDLKPANVLVTPSGRAMVADFGLSASEFLPAFETSALSDPTRTATMSLRIRTATGKSVRGTPAYMSPEQARGEQAKPISDVYGLGAVLFWLLAGSDPHRARRGEDWLTLLARVSDETDPTPSLPAGVHPTLARICRKAMRKRPEERYLAASAMLADLQALLEDRVPMGVGPDTAWQPLQLWARRNSLPVFVAAAAVVGLAMLAGVALAQRNSAVASERKATAAAAEERRTADRLRKVSDFQSRMLAQLDTTKAGIDLMADVRRRFAAALERAGVSRTDREASVEALRRELVRVNATDLAAAMIDRTILTPAIAAIDEQFKGDPVTDAGLRHAVGTLYRSIGLYDAAMPLQESALVTRRRVLGSEHPDTLRSINDLGMLLLLRGKLAEADPHLHGALRQRRLVLGEEHPDTLASIDAVAKLLMMQGRLGEAEPYLFDALSKRRRVLGDEHPDTLDSIKIVGSHLLLQSKFHDAEAYHLEGLETSRRTLGEDHPITLTALSNWGDLLFARGEPIAAEPHYREVLEKRRRVLGEEHPSTLISTSNLGGLLLETGRLAEAEVHLRDALEKSRRVRGEEHPSTLSYVNSVGDLLFVQGRLIEAESCYREALDSRRRVLGEEHSATLVSMNNLGSLLLAMERFSEAEPYLLAALEKSRRVRGDNHPSTIDYLRNVSAVHDALGRFDAAEGCLREAVDRARRVHGVHHARTLGFTVSLARVLTNRGRPDEAVELLVAAEATAREARLDDVRPLADLMLALGCARAGLGHRAGLWPLAEANLLEAHAIYLEAKDRGPTHKDTLACAAALADLYAALDRAEPGQGHAAKAAAWRTKSGVRLDPEPVP